MALNRRTVGAVGENVAANYLKGRGYRIVERNYRVRFGEIDIIAEQEGDLVFVEVKTRTDDLFGSPLESVTARKQKQLSKIALDYMSRQGCVDRNARFDVVGIRLQQGAKGAGPAEIELLQNAFDLCYD